MTGANDTHRLAVVTGASSGIGEAAAVGLARAGWAVTLVGRDPGRLDEAVRRVRAAAQQHADGSSAGRNPAPVTSFQADYTRLDSVRELAAALREAYPSIDVLANNAGGAYGRRMTTVDGFEQTIQVNHLAPFLLSHQLRPVLAGGRIVNTSSGAHAQGVLDPDDLSRSGAPYRMWAVYGSSKQANILFTTEAARRWPEVSSTCFHPGVVRTRFGSDRRVVGAYFKLMPGLRTPEQGADTLIWLTTTADQLTDGGYYVDRRLTRPRPSATDRDLASRLWTVSAEAVGVPA
jgi:NAD(P)-dependent dehydrogenase (short-subunit alcohol dehydrogenase family)